MIILVVARISAASAWSLCRPTSRQRIWSMDHRLAAAMVDDHEVPPEALWRDLDLLWHATDNPKISYFHYSDLQDQHPLAPTVATATYQWADRFVARHNLCPWAERSVQTKNALQIIVLTVDSEGDVDEQLEGIATRFDAAVDSGQADGNTAIFFCVLLPPKQDDNRQQHWTTDFASFDDWYLGMEDAWFDRADETDEHIANRVTLAPFHPQWQFADDAADSSSSLEKQSPFPTITMVSTRVIERAGEAATQQIFDSNQATLASKTPEEWSRLYQQAVFGDES